MKFIASAILFLLFTSTFYSQIVDSDEYKKAKANGQLDIDSIINPNKPAETDHDKPKPYLVERGSNQCFGFKQPSINATPTLAGLDDASSGIINLPFDFCFYGTVYNSLYINSNGNVTFALPSSNFSATGFPTSSGNPRIAPFWADIDFSDPRTGSCYYEIFSDAIVIHWEDAGYYKIFGNGGDKLNSFMLILTDGNSSMLSSGNNVGFFYEDMAWTTGESNGGIDGFGGTPATVGIDKGDNSSFIQIGRFNMDNTSYDGPYGSADGVHWLDNQVFMFNACSSTNIAPVVTDFNFCDTVYVCLDTEISLNFSVLSGESNQTTVIEFDTTNVLGFNLNSNVSGNIADFSGSFTSSALNVGNNTIRFWAFDDYVPADTTFFTVNIFVYNQTISVDIIGNDIICSNEFLTLEATPGYESYLWNTGNVSDTTDTISISSAGTYSVEVFSGFCYYTAEFDVSNANDPDITFTTPVYFCPNESNYHVEINDDYVDYLWNTGETINEIYTDDDGTYTVTVTSSNGCVLSDFITLTKEPQIYAFQDTVVTCNDSYVVNLNNTNADGGEWFFQSTGSLSFSPSSTIVNPTISSQDNVQFILGYVDNRCNDTANVLVNFIDVPVPIIYGKDTICLKDTVKLNTSLNFGETATWTGPVDMTVLSDSSIIGFNAGLYTLTTTNICGTSASSVNLVVQSCSVPNVITPGGTPGVNDKFYTRYADVYNDVNLTIYNRWGRVVYKSESYDNSWSGEKSSGAALNSGVYYYVMTWDENTKDEAGTITVFDK